MGKPQTRAKTTPQTGKAKGNITKKGDKGAKGDKDNKGAKGDKGNKGNKCDHGLRGPPGPAGETTEDSDDETVKILDINIRIRETTGEFAAERIEKIPDEVYITSLVQTHHN